MEWEWRYETDRDLLRQCWLPLAVWTSVLSDFVDGKLLAITFTTLVPLVFLLFLYFNFLCNDDTKSDHAHHRHTNWSFPTTPGMCWKLNYEVLILIIYLCFFVGVISADFQDAFEKFVLANTKT